jgi:hypothetical protein
VRKHDEVLALMVLKHMGLEQPVPEHLKEEFDRRWAEREENRKSERLKNDPLFAQRYDDDGFQDEDGSWILYDDFVKAVEHLKQKVSQAYQSGYSSGGDTYSWRL